MKIYTLLLYCASCLAGEKHVTISNTISVEDNSQATQTTPLKAALLKKNSRERQPEIVRQDNDKDEVTCCCFIKLRKRI